MRWAAKANCKTNMAEAGLASIHCTCVDISRFNSLIHCGDLTGWEEFIPALWSDPPEGRLEGAL